MAAPIFNAICRVGVCALALSTLPAAAAEGVVLIGQKAGFPISINLPGSYRLSGNLTVPAGVNGIEINADGVTLDMNGYSITGPGVFPNGGSAIVSNRQRIAVNNGSIAGFVSGLIFFGDARFIRLDKIQIDASTRTEDGAAVGGLAARIGTNRASHALVNDMQAIGQVQITCPGNIRNSAVSVVEMNVPPDGTGISFPTNCRGDNIISAPFN